MFQWWGFPGVASLSKLLTLTKSSADQKEHQDISHICQTNKQKKPFFILMFLKTFGENILCSAKQKLNFLEALSPITSGLRTSHQHANMVLVVWWCGVTLLL